MTKELIIDKNYYINFLVKIYRERHWHEDFQNLNKKKLNILNKYLGLEGFIDFDFKNKRFKFIPLETLNLSKLKLINGYNKFNNFENKNEFNNFASYINMYFNNILDKLTKENYSIISGIELCTNDTNEFVKKLMNSYNKDLIISSHMQQIKAQYKEVIETLFNVLYTEDFLDENQTNIIKWNVEITNIDDLNKLNEFLYEYDYL